MAKKYIKQIGHHFGFHGLRLLKPSYVSIVALLPRPEGIGDSLYRFAIKYKRKSLSVFQLRLNSYFLKYQFFSSGNQSIMPILCMYNSSANKTLRIIPLGIHGYFFFMSLIQFKVSYTFLLLILFNSFHRRICVFRVYIYSVSHGIPMGGSPLAANATPADKQEKCFIGRKKPYYQYSGAVISTYTVIIRMNFRWSVPELRSFIIRSWSLLPTINGFLL